MATNHKLSHVEKRYLADRFSVSFDEERLAKALSVIRRQGTTIPSTLLNRLGGESIVGGTNDTKVRAAVAEALSHRLSVSSEDGDWYLLKTADQKTLAFQQMIEIYLPFADNDYRALTHFIKTDEALSLIERIEEKLKEVRLPSGTGGAKKKGAMRMGALKALYALATDPETAETFETLPIEMKVEMLHIEEIAG